MSQTLQEGKSMDTDRYLQTLSKDLSQATANLLLNSLANNSSCAVSDLYNSYWLHHDYERFAQWKSYQESYYQQFHFSNFNNNYNINCYNNNPEFNYNCV